MIKIKSAKAITLLLFIAASSIYGHAQQLTLDDVPLTWNDFRHVEKTKSGRAASVGHGIRRDITFLSATKGLLHSELYIDTVKSEVKSGALEKGSDFQKQCLLEHEKGHIAIGLIYHKMLEKTLSATVFTCQGPEEMKSLYRKFEKLINDINDRYDTETKHGTDFYQQKTWKKNILEQLNSAYSIQRPIPLTFTMEINTLIMLKNKTDDPLSYDYCNKYSVAFEENFEKSATEVIDASDTIAQMAHGLLTVNNHNNVSKWVRHWHQPIDYARDFEIDLLFQVGKINSSKPYAFNLYWGLDTASGRSATIQVNIDGEGVLRRSYRENNKENSVDTFTFKKLGANGFSKLSVRKIKDKYHVFINNKFAKEIQYETLSGQEILLSVPEQASVTFDHLDIFYLN